MLLIVGICVMKWAAGIELALQPDSAFAMKIVRVYSAFTGVFATRTGHLLRLTRTDNRLKANAM